MYTLGGPKAEKYAQVDELDDFATTYPAGIDWVIHEVDEIGHRAQIAIGEASVRIVTALGVEVSKYEQSVLCSAATTTYPAGISWTADEVVESGHRVQIVIGEAGTRILIALGAAMSKYSHAVVLVVSTTTYPVGSNWIADEVAETGQRVQTIIGETGVRMMTALGTLMLKSAHAVEFVVSTTTYPAGIGWMADDVGESGHRVQIVIGELGVRIVMALGVPNGS